MAYCEKCGNQVNDNAMFCSACGQKRGSVGQQQNTNNYNANTTYNGNVGYNSNFNNLNNAHPLVNELSKKIKIESIVWIVIASFQSLVAIINLFTYFDSYYPDSDNLVNGIIFGVIATLNFVVAIKDMNYSKEILVKPFGIVDKFKPIGSYIGTLFYNLIFGGVIGVAGSILGLVTRNFVMKNEFQFKEIENNYVNDNIQAPVFGNQWKCRKCGNINPYNTHTCRCGQSKKEN